MSRLALLRNRHAGERALLVANGPSLNRMDLRFLNSETTIGLNKIFLGLRDLGFYPRYLVAVNAKVLEQSAAELRKLTCVKFIAKRAAAFLPEDALTYHIDTSNPPYRFCRDVTAGIHEGWTVTYAGLQIAYFLGFREVVLIGLDHRYRYYGTPNQASVLYGSDPNHFCCNYFGHGQEWDNPDLTQSEESYRIARRCFERDGRRIIDATVDGACSVFDKVDYQEFFHV